MTGEELKQILQRDNINLSELARKLGFSNDQRLHSALRAADVRSDLVAQIAKVTNKTVGHFFGEDDPAVDCGAPVAGSLHPEFSPLSLSDAQPQRSTTSIESSTSEQMLALVTKVMEHNDRLAARCERLAERNDALVDKLDRRSEIMEAHYTRLIDIFDDLRSTQSEQFIKNKEFIEDSIDRLNLLRQTFNENSQRLWEQAEANLQEVLEKCKTASFGKIEKL